MNALIIFLVAMVILVIGYVCYGGWLAKQWGVDPKRPTPAHELEDGVDYVPAPPMWCSATTFRRLPAQARSTARFRRRSLAGCRAFVGARWRHLLRRHA